MTVRKELLYSGAFGVKNRMQLIEQIRNQMSEKRLNHVLGVERMAIRLAKENGVALEQASIAALVHDYAKERSDSEMIQIIKEQKFDQDLLVFGNPIWHGIVGAYLIEHELGITDPEIIEAVKLHTTGAKKMSQLAKVIYVADYVEEGRDFPLVEEARKIAFENLDQAVAFETKHTLAYLVNKEVKIYPKTIETYNQWVAGQ